jgi:hypothetical protein
MDNKEKTLTEKIDELISDAKETVRKKEAEKRRRIRREKIKILLK